MDIWAVIIEQWQNQSYTEVAAVVLAIAYVWLASQESIWCWPAGFLSTALFAIVYWEVTLIFQMMLNVYYMGMAVWGFIAWRIKGDKRVSISKMTLAQHVIFIVIGGILSTVSYMVAIHLLDYNLISVDLGVSVFSVIATYLTLKKRLESWYYWCVINIVSMYLYWETGLFLTALLMIVYLTIAIRGVFRWHSNYVQEAQVAQSL